jgi:hypothetical protein
VQPAKWADARCRTAEMDSPLQLAPASWQYWLDAAHQQTRSDQEQPILAPHLTGPTLSAFSNQGRVIGRLLGKGIGPATDDLSKPADARAFGARLRIACAASQ